MKKVLFVATVVKTHINVFHIPYLKMLKEMGYETHVAARNDFEDPKECIIPYCDYYHDIPFERSPIRKNNITSYKKLKQLMLKENFDIVHCHTPVGGAITRLVYKNIKSKVKTKCIYTAHGFHFFKGAPLKNWILFYPIEKYLSKYTDVLITINKEDYQRAKEKFKMKQLEFIHGVGVDENKYIAKIDEEKKKIMRQQLGLSINDFIIIYVAELSKRKNQGMLINAVNKLVLTNKNVRLLLVGKDSMNGYYQNMVKELGIEENVNFLGFREDIPNLLRISNLYVSTSKQEGLPINLLEAMCINLPIIATNCRGNNELADNGNASLVDINNEDELIEKIKCMNYKKSKLPHEYSLDYVKNEMRNIYNSFNNTKKLAIITSGFLPVPATKGGAAENLVEVILYMNEEYDMITPIIISTYEKKARLISKKFNNSKFIYIKPNIIAFNIDKFNYFIIDKIIKKKNSRKFRYFFQRLDFLYKCSKILKKNYYDIVLLENHTIMYLALKLKKNYLKYENRYYYHCHNVVPSTFRMDYIINKTKKFISVSKFRSDYIKDFLNLSNEKLSVVYNCCSKDIYVPATENDILALKEKYGISNEKIILYVGRVDQDKGTWELVKACNNIKNIKFKLIIVGAPIFATGITTDYEKKVKEEIKNNSDKYLMTGYVEHSELYKYYAMADVVAIPSQVEDSAPLVLIESLTCGKPIVATKCGGIPEYVNDKCSILIEKNENFINSLTKALELIISNDSIIASMSAESLKKSKDYSDIKYYKDFINEILK